MRRRLTGSVAGVASAMALGAVLLPLRSHLAVSTVALVLVIPVVVGAVVGGFYAGVASTAVGFLVYDYLFVPPYRTLDVGTAQNWTALGVYGVVTVLVARVVASLNTSRSEAQRGNDTMLRLSELSELLIGDRPVDDLLTTIVQAAHHVFGIEGVALLVPEGGRLQVAASTGEEFTSAELHQLDPLSGLPVRVGTAPGTSSEVRTIALTASDRPVGILVLRGLPESERDRAALITFANDAALALERATLREQALRSQFLEDADRFRRGLMGAVSHDLRTPLATIKLASSTLSHRASNLSPEAAHELHELIEIESDRLTRLVNNLLDMTRIEAGVFTVHRVATSVLTLVSEALGALGPTVSEGLVIQEIPESLAKVEVDQILIGQVLVNLLDNAIRHSPPGGVITVKGEVQSDLVVLSVADQGPGVAPGDREAVFNRFAQFNTGGRAGLGLTIAKTFVEAHGQHIWCDETPGGGARFSFTLPLANDHAGGR